MRAPASGTVVGLDVHTVGGVIRSGDTLLEIVPRNDRLLVELQVRPLDIDNLAVGQPAEVRLLALKQRVTPTLTGQLVLVSADSLSDKRTGHAYFLARVAISDAELARLGNGPLLPGMPAEAMIKTGERTVLAYLSQPILDAVSRAWREE